MSNPMALIANRLPKVTAEDVRRFADTVVIRDAEGFAAELDVFMQERLERIELPANTVAAPRTATEAALTQKAAAVRAGSRWTPALPDSSLAARPCWRPTTGCTTCRCRSSRGWRTRCAQQIYKDIDAGRLLALNVGPRGRRLPD